MTTHHNKKDPPGELTKEVCSWGPSSATTPAASRWIVLEQSGPAGRAGQDGKAAAFGSWTASRHDPMGAGQLGDHRDELSKSFNNISRTSALTDPVINAGKLKQMGISDDLAKRYSITRLYTRQTDPGGLAATLGRHGRMRTERAWRPRRGRGNFS